MSIFLLEKSAEYLEKGFKLAREGNLKTARSNLLKAAEFLYKAAEESESWSKQKRIERAEEILKKAHDLEHSVSAKKPIKVPQGEDVDAADWLVYEKPDVVFDEVAGLDDVKEQIRIRMIYPFTHPDLAKRFRIKKGGGLLLYGPPGTGKTMLAKAVATEIDAAFFTVRPSDVMSKWVGVAEQNISKLFGAARNHNRSIIFIDEIEALIPKRKDGGSTVMQRVVPQILSEMEGFDKSDTNSYSLLFIGATNKPWSLDDAVLRPGRFDERIYIPLPDSSARLSMLYLYMKDKPLSTDISLEEINQLLEGYSGADIRRICEKSSEIPFIESVRTGEDRIIEKRDILQAIEQIKPSVSPAEIEKYERFAG